MESLKQIMLSLRDLFIPFLPHFIVRLLVGEGDFIFLVHPVDLIDIAKKYPFINKMPKRFVKTFSRFLWPVIGSKVVGYETPKGPVVGWVVFCPLATKIMLLKKDVARKKILKAVKFSEKLGAKVIGLGAFIPIVSDDGLFLIDKIKVNFTTGTAYAAIISVQNIIKISEKLEIDTKKVSLAIVGAGGSVGSICSKMLMNKFGIIMLIDRDSDSLNTLLRELKILYKTLPKIKISNQINDMAEADIVLVVTNVPGSLVKPSYPRPGAIVIDGGFPKNVSKRVLQERKDVLVIDSGIAEIKGLNINFNFQLGIRKNNEVFSCLAEVLLLLWLDKKGNYAGKIDYDYVKELLENSEKAGIRLADFRNESGYITDVELSNFKKFLYESESKHKNKNLLNMAIGEE